MNRVDGQRDSQIAVLLAGLVIIVFGTQAVLMGVSGGWGLALVVTLALGAVAGFVKPSRRETRILRLLVAVLAVVSSVGLVIDVVLAVTR